MHHGRSVLIKQCHFFVFGIAVEEDPLDWRGGFEAAWAFLRRHNEIPAVWASVAGEDAGARPEVKQETSQVFLWFCGRRSDKLALSSVGLI